MTPEIATKRLRLRPWLDSDRAPFAALNADPRVMAHFPSLLTAEQSDALADRIQQHFQTPRFVAHFTPCVEVGWRLAAEYWGVGYATEGAMAALQFGFGDLQLEQIVSFTVPGNTRSRRVMEKIGMVHTPADDFDYPLLPDGHALRRHVLYRIDNPLLTRADVIASGV